MRYLLLVAAAAALIASGGPAAAVPTTEEQRVPATGSEPEVERAAAEMEAYGNWLLRIGQLQAPANQALQDLHGAWQNAAASGDMRRTGPTVRAVVGRTLELLDQADAQLAAVETPDFPSLDLPDDLRTAALLAVARQTNRQVRAAIESAVPMLEAFERDDRRATEAALLRMVDALLQVLESQVALGRASLAATPREESTWEMTNIDLLTARTGARILAVLPAVQAGTGDPELGSDLVRFADELETSAGAGEQKLDAELAELAAALAEAEVARDRASQTILRRAIAALRAGRRLFPLAHSFAGTLRRESARLRGGANLEAVRAVSSALRETRWEIDRIGIDVAAAVASD